ncbi:MAG: PaaI family thioesterase [Chloroflexi bacterium]|nr:PaaI family thioesterase [Chloroflexota bacterium]
MTDVPRTRTITWDDPMTGALAAPTLSGLDYMQAMIAGKVPRPPIAVLLNFHLVEVAYGRSVFVGEPAEYHYNPIGTVHGGLIATLLDSALGCAVHTTLPVGLAYTTLELHVNFVRPLTKDTGAIRCEGAVLHRGSRLATAEAKVFDRAGKLYGHGTTTCMIFPAGG